MMLSKVMVEFKADKNSDLLFRKKGRSLFGFDLFLSSGREMK